MQWLIEEALMEKLEHHEALEKIAEAEAEAVADAERRVADTLARRRTMNA